MSGESVKSSGMAAALTKSCKWLLIVMGVALVVSEILEQATNLHRLGYLVGCLFLAVWVASFPLGAISFFLEKRKKTEEYTWPVLLLVASSILLALALLGMRTMIL